MDAYISYEVWVVVIDKTAPWGPGKIAGSTPVKGTKIEEIAQLVEQWEKIYSVVKGVNSNVQCLRKTMCRQFDSVSPHHQPGKVKKETYSKFNDF